MEQFKRRQFGFGKRAVNVVLSIVLATGMTPSVALAEASQGAATSDSAVVAIENQELNLDNSVATQASDQAVEATGSVEAESGDQSAVDAATVPTPEEASAEQPLMQDSLPMTLVGETVTSTFSGGSGTKGDPYQISTAADFDELATNVNLGAANGGTTYADTYFVLTNDVDLSDDAKFVPIGTYTNDTTYAPFSGHFEGNGCTVTLNLKVGVSISKGVGLFGYTFGTSARNCATISNLNIEGTVTASSSVSVGGVAGIASNTEITGCTVNAKVVGNQYVGGIIGSAGPFTGAFDKNDRPYDLIQDCQVNGDVLASNQYNSFVGGIAGVFGSSGGDSLIDSCIVTGTVTATTTTSITSSFGNRVGGIVGHWYVATSSAAAATMSNCLMLGSALCRIDTLTAQNDGALVGTFGDDTGSARPSTNIFKNCYAQTEKSTPGIGLWGWNKIDTKTDCGLMTPAELKTKAFALSLGEYFVQTTTAPTLVRNAPYNPYVGEIAAEGLDDKGSIATSSPVTLTADAALPQMGAGAQGTLNYEWYVNTEDSTEGGTLLEGTESSIQVTSDTPQTLYYYCLVTNKADGGDASLCSPTQAVIYVGSAAPVTPTIETNPVGATLPQKYTDKDEDGIDLTVVATVTDKGVLSYQWMSRAQGAEDWTAIEGATEATYRASAAKAGTNEFKCVVTNMLNLKTVSIETDPVTVEVQPTEINTAEELEAFATRVNGSSYKSEDNETFEGMTFVLTDNLDLSSYEWKPIGFRMTGNLSIQYTHPFAGIFDGQGHTISGLNVTNQSTSYNGKYYGFGLFGIVEDATIENLVVEGSSVVDGSYVGGVVGRTLGDTKLVNLGYEGTLTGASYVGGIVGYTGEDADLATITSCYNKATINADSHSGGIVGYAPYTAISTCYNAGAVSGEDYCGGIAGHTTYSNGGGSSSIANCYNVGTLVDDREDDESSLFIGAIVGDYAMTYPQANYYLEGTATNSAYYASPSSMIESTAATMRSRAFVSTLNEAAAGSWVFSTTGGYPVLSWEHQISTQVVTVELSPAEMLDLEIVVKDAAGNEYYSEEQTGLTRTYHLPDGANYFVTAKKFGFKHYNGIIEVGSEPVTYSLVMEASAYYNVAFNLTAPAGFDAEDAWLWIDSPEYGVIKSKISAATGQNISLPEGTYTYSWILSGCERQTGTVDVVDGDQSFDIAFAEPAVWDGVTTTAPLKDAVGTYWITSPAELAGFRDLVNASDKGDLDAVMTSDIKLNPADDYENTWLPIGTTDVEFRGSFDGQGHVINGLYIDSLDDYQGLFGVAYNGASISNLVVAGTVRTDGDYAAGILAYAEYSGITITNCGSNVNVVAGTRAGGVMGYLKQGTSTQDRVTTIKNCYNKGTVTGTFAPDYESNYVGGIMGGSNGGAETSLVIDNCYNLGDITAYANVAGGILGIGSSTLTSCYNVGKVVHQSQREVYANASGAIVGAYSTSRTFTATNCSYLSTSSDRAFGYYSDSVPSETATAFDDASFFTPAKLQNLGMTGFTVVTKATYNDGYPRLTWENEKANIDPVPDMKGSETNPWLISSYEDLVKFQQRVAAGKTYAGEFVKLTADLDLEGLTVSPIGTGTSSSNAYFAGTFDGDFHKITNMDMTVKSESYYDDSGAGVGLFGQTRGATIKNLDISGAVDGTIWVGGIIGYGYNTWVKNCVSRVDCNADPTQSDDGQGIYVAGIVGQCYTGVEGAGGIESCVMYGTTRSSVESDKIAAITTLGTSQASVEGCYYLDTSNERGCDVELDGVHGADSLESPEIAWNLNTCDGKYVNSLIWGVREGSGVEFANGTDVFASLHVDLDQTAAFMSVSPTYIQPGTEITVTINQVKKGYTLTGGLVFQERNAEGELVQTYAEGSIPTEFPHTCTYTVNSNDVYVSLAANLDPNTAFDLTTKVVDENGGTTRTADVIYKDEDGNVVTTAKAGDTVYAWVSDIDATSQYHNAGAVGAYGTTLDLDMTKYGRCFEFTMPAEDVTFTLGLQAKGAAADGRDASLDVVADNFHIANSAYETDGAYLNADIVVDDDGSAGITDYYSSTTPMQNVENVAFLEGSLTSTASTSTDYYEQVYTVRAADGSVSQAEYAGIMLDTYLTKWCGMSKDLDASTLVTIYSRDGQSVQLTIGDIRGYAYNSYVSEGEYAGDFIARGLPVMLAAGCDGTPFSMEEGGPLRLVVGQTSADDVNATKQLGDVYKIVVGDPAKATTARHDHDPYDEFENDAIYVDVIRNGETVSQNIAITVADVEAYMDAHASAHTSNFITGSRFGEGAELQYTAESDYYEGISIYELLKWKAGVTLNDVANPDATVSYYEEPYSTSAYELVTTTSLSYLAGGSSAEKDYSDCTTEYDGYTTTGVVPMIAVAKNGLPLVEYATDSGANATYYNYRGPFIAVLPQNTEENVVVTGGEEGDAWISTYFGKIVLNLGEATDKSELEDLISIAQADCEGVVASDTGLDVTPGTEFVPTSVMETYTAAIAEAQAVVDNAAASQSDVDAATGALEEAWTAMIEQRMGIITQPESVSVFEGVDVTLQAEAEGEPTHYQWQQFVGGQWVNSSLPSSGESTMTFEMSTAHDRATWRCLAVYANGATAISATATTELLRIGDVNGNGRINIMDAQVTLDLANGVYGAAFEKFPLPDTWTLTVLRTVADANSDTVVDATDARCIQHFIHFGNFTEQTE